MAGPPSDAVALLRSASSTRPAGAGPGRALRPDYRIFVRTFDTVEELRRALLEFRDAYNTTWLIERHGFRTPDAVRREQLQPAALAVEASTRCPSIRGRYRVWLFLRERFLSHRLLEGYDTIVDACCQAWNALTPERIRSLTAYPWIAWVIS